MGDNCRSWLKLPVVILVKAQLCSYLLILLTEIAVDTTETIREDWLDSLMYIVTHQMAPSYTNDVLLGNSIQGKDAVYIALYTVYT